MTHKIARHAPPKAKDSTSMKPKTTGLWSDRPEIEKPVVFFTQKAREKVDLLVATVRTEVGWWGTVERHGVHYLITDIFVPRQTVTGTTTEIPGEALAELAFEIMDAGGDPEQLRYWGHSHVNFGVSPSPQDEKQVQQYLPDVPWFIRGIHNKRGEQKIDVYDCQNNTLHQCVDSQVVRSLSDIERKTLHEQVNSRVVEEKPAMGFGFGTHYSDASRASMGKKRPRFVED